MSTLTGALILGIAGAFLAPLLIWFSISVWRRPIFALASGLTLTVFSLTHYGTPELRYALAVLLIPHFAAAVRNSRLQPRGALPAFTVPVLFVIAAFLSAIWSRTPMDSALSATAWVILLLFIFTFRLTVSTEHIRQVVFYVLLVFFLLSLIFLVSPEAWEADRARGLFFNANTAGIFTLLLIGCSLWMGRKYWPWVIPAGLVYISATGSRAALLGAVTILLVFAIASVGWRYRLVLGGLAAAIVYPVALWALNTVQQLQVNDATSVLRSDNTRSDRWGASLEYIQQNPWLGAGYGAAPYMVDHNSYAKLFAEFGVVMAAFGVALIVAYVWWSRRDPVMLGITFGALFNTFFEDWLLSAGASMLVIYLLLVMSTPQRTRDRDGTGEDHEDHPVSHTDSPATSETSSNPLPSGARS